MVRRHANGSKCRADGPAAPGDGVPAATYDRGDDPALGDSSDAIVAGVGDKHVAQAVHRQSVRSASAF